MGPRFLPTSPLAAGYANLPAGNSAPRAANERSGRREGKGSGHRWSLGRLAEVLLDGCWLAGGRVPGGGESERVKGGAYPWVLGSSHWVVRVLWLTK